MRADIKSMYFYYSEDNEIVKLLSGEITRTAVGQALVLWLSSEVTWTAVDWIIDTEPRFIHGGRVSEIGSSAAAEFFAVCKHIGIVCKLCGIKIVLYIDGF